jgi:hypothetical protein
MEFERGHTVPEHPYFDYVVDAAEGLICNPDIQNLHLRGKDLPVGIAEAVESAITASNLLDLPTSVTEWQRRYLELTGEVRGNLAVWLEVIFCGGDTYEERFINFARAHIAAAAQYAIENGPNRRLLADIAESNVLRHKRGIAEKRWQY